MRRKLSKESNFTMLLMPESFKIQKKSDNNQGFKASLVSCHRQLLLKDSEEMNKN
jgi:hypothetical protein